MKCTELETLISAWADGEADAVQADFAQRHVLTCPECAARHSALLALRERVRAEVPRYRAPAALRARVRRAAAASAKPARMPWQPLRERWPWIGGGALAGCLGTILAWSVGTTFMASRANDEVAVAAVSMHTAASIGGHVIDVASSDRHTVKPWLAARLDYSPPVLDLAPEGFPLIGGRVDHLQGQRVAALVYRHGQHSIDVFVRPLGAHVAPASLRTVRGFHVVRAGGATMEWIAVSDVEADALSALVTQLAREDVAQ
jgi:anti-sigma factor RsiW